MGIDIKDILISIPSTMIVVSKGRRGKALIERVQEPGPVYHSTTPHDIVVSGRCLHAGVRLRSFISCRPNIKTASSDIWRKMVAEQASTEMQHNQGPDEDQELVNLNNPAPEPESPSDSIAARQDLEIAAQPSCSNKLLVVLGAHKAMAASVPGTEYWLP